MCLKECRVSESLKFKAFNYSWLGYSVIFKIINVLSVRKLESLVSRNLLIVLNFCSLSLSLSLSMNSVSMKCDVMNVGTNGTQVLCLTHVIISSFLFLYLNSFLFYLLLFSYSL
uniref:Uncharacterized protein n=1 Tax=Cacopsylla melanoneura TaxID=428564 RepID=A0A8D9E0A9_9HEMI